MAAPALLINVIMRFPLCVSRFRYDHLGYAPGELVTIPYATLVWLTHL